MSLPWGLQKILKLLFPLREYGTGVGILIWSVKELGTPLYARSLKSLFHLRSRHRYGILSGVGSPPDQEEVEAAGAEPAQGHLLHVEQAQDRLDQAEKEDIDVDLNIDIDISKSSTWTRQW